MILGHDRHARRNAIDSAELLKNIGSAIKSEPDAIVSSPSEPPVNRGTSGVRFRQPSFSLLVNLWLRNILFPEVSD